MNITKLFLLASAGLAAVAFTPAAQAHEGHHHHKHHGECHAASCESSDRPYYYTSNPDLIYVNPANNSYRGASDNVVLIAGHRSYRNHRAN